MRMLDSSSAPAGYRRVKVLHEARMALTELARRSHEADHLENPRQLFMALDAELDVLAMAPVSMTETLATRGRRWQSLLGLDLPMFVDGSQPIAALSTLSKAGDAVVLPARPRWV